MILKSKQYFKNIRYFTSCASRQHSFPLSISPEIQQAISDRKPIVALESTIITHGLPYPQNLQMANSVEQIIRNEGAVPATTAFINGIPKVGTTPSDLEYLSNTSNKQMEKISRRDIPYIMSKKLTGGTTIAGTMILANKANIKVFATGGLGGVHRGVESTWDISADLDELGKTPVGVICSGPKSILDISKTLEYLETKGVHVSTLGSSGTNIPGFYTRDSGIKSPFNFQTPEEAAEILYWNHAMKLNSGTVFCIPAPEEIALSKEFIDNIIDNAIVDCERLGIKGKDITPFLLSKIKDATGGQSVKTNVEFVKNNARIGAQIAISLARMENGGSGSDINSTMVNIPSDIPKAESAIASDMVVEPVKDKCDALVIGALATDLTCSLDHSGQSIVKTSYPGKIETTVGGVGHNITLAATYAGSNVRLVSEVGHDNAEIFDSITNEDLDTSGISVNPKKRSARYISMNDGSGELLLACADMDIIKDMSPNHIKNEIKRANPPIIFFDGNIGNEQKIAVISGAKSLDHCFVGFEPTSVPKASELSKLQLNIYPNHDINLATPNIDELQAMFESFHDNGKFDVDNWFPVIDALGVNETLRLSLENLARSKPELTDFIRRGIAQQALHILPYIPNLLVKGGSLGVISFQLLDAEEISQLRHYGPAERTNVSGSLISTQVAYRDDHLLGVLIQHFPAFNIKESDVVSVSGAGDSFCGVLIAELAKDKSWLYSYQRNKVEVIDKAQYAASLAIQCLNPVNERIKKIYEE